MTNLAESRFTEYDDVDDKDENANPNRDRTVSFGESSTTALTRSDLFSQSLPNDLSLKTLSASTQQYTSRPSTSKQTSNNDFVVIQKPENELEARRLENNYLFGYKKWKSHITERPLEKRSTIVQELYSDQEKISLSISTLSVGNVLYTCMFGWWLATLYIVIGVLMYLTIIGRHHGKCCFKLADYFLWPFGQFVKKSCPSSVPYPGEKTSLFSAGLHDPMNHSSSGYWKRPSTYLWLLMGLPVLLMAHAVIFLISWFLVIFIPVAKVNLKAIRKILLLPPETLEIDPHSMGTEERPRDIVLFTQQAVNIYYYKYTVDGMNVILVNLLVFVLLALGLGYIDTGNVVVSSETKFVLSLLAIIPLAYYIGQAITSLSAQSNFAVGAVLNATFGSIVEITLYVAALLKGYDEKTLCYDVLVKSALAGTLLATMLFIPGICMVIGGLKYRTQNFNPKSIAISSSLLFTSVAGVFAPTIFSRIFGILECQRCVYNVSANQSRDFSNNSFDLRCTMCQYSVFGLNNDVEFYNDHVQPLVYACAILLPLAYLTGLVFSLKTHSKDVHGKFIQASKQFAKEEGHSIAHWSRLKSLLILLFSTTLMSLSANLVTDHIQPVLAKSGASVYFIGVTLFALVPDIPEIVNGIQFALQNNINLSIEVGTTIAVQVCMLQVPVLVLVDVIHPLEFYLVFSDLLLWSVIFSVLVMNYVLQDGKSNYLQGTALCVIYIILIMMYFYSPDIGDTQC